MTKGIVENQSVLKNFNLNLILICNKYPATLILSYSPAERNTNYILKDVYFDSEFHALSNHQTEICSLRAFSLMVTQCAKLQVSIFHKVYIRVL